MAVSRSDDLLFQPGAVALFASATALVVPIVVFLASPDAADLDRVLGWIAPLMLLATLVSLPSRWDTNDWEPRDVTVQFLWFVLGVGVLGSAAVLFVLYIQAHGGSLVHPWFAITNWGIGGGIIGLLLGLYDRGQHRALEEVETARAEAERYGEQVEVLNRVLRHDIRNGVNIIQGHADIVESATRNGDSEASVTAIASAAGDLYELAEQARRLEEALDDSEGTSVELTALIQHKIDQTLDDGADADVDCRYETTATVTDPNRLGIALEQVLRNAIDHHPGTPHVEITTRTTDDGVVEVVVADDGEGLPPRERRVLDEREETQLQHSRGMGLWLSTWAIEATGGSLDVTSSSDGTTVIIRLPTV